MHELSQVIPDVNVLLGLEPEALGEQLLLLLQKRRFPNDMFLPASLTDELWPFALLPGQQPAYPYDHRDAINKALAEAWGWLEREGLIVPAADINGRNGWRILSRRGQNLTSISQFAARKTGQMLRKETLHLRIRERIWNFYVGGEFDVAAFQAMKAVEVSVREAAGYGNDKLGVPMMRDAFSPGKGPLADLSSEPGEQVARMELFAGAIGSYKNPQSHRDVDLNDPVEAMEIIFLANHLLRIVEARSKAKTISP